MGYVSEPGPSQDAAVAVPSANSTGSIANVSLRWALAIIVTFVALGARWLLDPALGDRVPYSLLYAAVAFASIYLGLGPALMASVIGLIGTITLFVPPRGALTIRDVPHAAEALTYVGVCTLIIAAGEINRRSKERLKTAHEELARRQKALQVFSSQLEDRVAERTVELKHAEDSARQLGGQVLRMQDDERKRIARELHDSLGQTAALLNLNLGRLGVPANLTQTQTEILSDTRQLAQGLVQEVRTISHLLHPPLLEEMGLPSALTWYVEGFSKRSEIATNVELDPDFGRLPPECEIAIFRIVQEALTNVHRHSGSKRATVRLCATPGEVQVAISDEGKGVPIEKRRTFASGGAMGVGLRGMRERVAQLGGVMDLRSSAGGTTVTATFPLSTDQRASAAMG
jgi:signal transduction histidine kinase